VSETGRLDRPWVKREERDMTHSLIGADQNTHLKIVAVALVAAIAVVIVGVTARVADTQTARAQIVKAGKPAAFTARDATMVR
jgi:hypothetical protein